MITILGASGFIGSHLVNRLRRMGSEHYAPGRNEDISHRPLGNVIYCIGLTADFRLRPFATVEAHVCVLNKILEKGNFDSLTYLSSTRVYVKCREKEVFENTPINISIEDPDELYTLTKLSGERLCLSSGCKTRVARLSNVYGTGDLSENFVSAVIKSIRSQGHVKFFTTPSSAKDYISVDNVCELLLNIADRGTQSIYNVASGYNISNGDIINKLKKQYKFDYEFAHLAKEIIFPGININRIISEFGFEPGAANENLLELIKTYNNDTN